MAWASLSTHVLDVSAGRPAMGIRVALFRGDDCVGRGETDDDGRIRELGRELSPGRYRIEFELPGRYFERVSLVVRLDAGHHHVPLLVSPFGCVTYRGG